MIGTLPSNYQPSEPSSRHNNKFFWIVPLLICACLFWFAYNQWQSTPKQIELIPKPKERVWWMPDLIKSLPPFADGYRVEKYLERYNLSTCVISGNFEHLNSAIACFLFNPRKFAEQNVTISRFDKKLCGNGAPLTLSNHKQFRQLNENPARRVMWVQEPLERFARQFYRFCERRHECFNCGTDMMCFMRKMLMQHSKVAQGLAGNVRTHLTDNFSPQTWNCHLHTTFKLVEPITIGGNETQLAEFLNSYSTILREQGVKETLIENISREVMKIPLKLSKREEQIMEEIRTDTDKKRLFRYLYEHDYTVLGFKMF